MASKLAPDIYICTSLDTFIFIRKFPLSYEVELIVYELQLLISERFIFHL